MKNYTTRILQAAVLALTLAGTQAFAQSEILTQTFTNQSPGSLNLNFDTFNSSLGTLDSVEISLVNVSVSGSAYATNISNLLAPPGYNESITLSFSNTY